MITLVNKKLAKHPPTKHNNNSVFSRLCKSLMLLSSVSLVPMTAIAQEERWFEIEVILFHQLTDRSTLKEQFPEQQSNQNNEKYFDLILNQLRPDISLLKQSMPRCDGSSAFMPLPAHHDNKFDVAEQIQQPSALVENTDNVTQANIDDVNPASTSQLSALQTQEVLPLPTNDLTLTTTNENETNDSQPSLVNFDLARELAAIANQQFGAKLLHTFVNQVEQDLISEQTYGEVFTPIELSPFTRDFACVNQDKYDPWQPVQASDEQDFIPIDSVPLKITGIEKLGSDRPYLLSDESLQFGYIMTQLKRSREFRPLLHLGWRQATLAKKDSVPVKIIAGDNLAVQYQRLNAMKLWQAEQIEQPEQLAFDAITRAEKLKNIINNALLGNYNIEEELANVGKLSNDDELLISLNQEILPPKQEWLLDGFFNVHLQHYLYISANFNFYNNITVDLSKQSKDKVINFSQNNRRVISEQIHYFDHPYIGMIAQIRKYQRPEPEEDIELNNSQTPQVNTER